MKAEGRFSIVTMTKQASSAPGWDDCSCWTPAHTLVLSWGKKESRANLKWSEKQRGFRFVWMCWEAPHTHTHSPCSMDRDSHSEDTLSTMVLENIKNKLIHAFRAAGESNKDLHQSGSAVRPMSISGSYLANEELRRAQIDGALTWLRSELVSSQTGFLIPCSSEVFSREFVQLCCWTASNFQRADSVLLLVIRSWRCARRTSSWLRHCWGSTQRSKDWGGRALEGWK